VSELDDHARQTGLLGGGFVAGEPEDPAGCAARVVAEQALSIFKAAEATASEIEARGGQQAEELAGAADEAVAVALSRLHAISRQLDALAADVDQRNEELRHGG
jgi:3-methyladenine DNA glycosylase/8-oxoguanine DNA glycosylase